MADDAEGEELQVTPESIERARVRVEELSSLIKKCGHTLEEVYETVKPFYNNSVMCLAINRNLLNMLETVQLVRFVSDEVGGLLAELQESLQLCLAFLQEYSLSSGAVEEREIGAEETEEVVNKLAFMNKLLHLNQHSLSIRLLIEIPEHSRLELEARSARTAAAIEGRAGLGPEGRPKLTNLAYGKAHTRQESFAPIMPPTWFQPETRAAEWAQVQDALKAVPDNESLPVILFVTGPSGVGKTSYARYVAHKLAYLDYHCVYSASDPAAPGQLDPVFKGAPAAAAPPASAPSRKQRHNNNNNSNNHAAHARDKGGRRGHGGGGNDDGDDDDDEEDEEDAGEEDAETVMRSLLAPQQVRDLSPSEIQGAFRALFWRRRGVLLLDNVQSEAQVAALLPTRGACFVIVTSVRPFPALLKRASSVVKIHQHLEALGPTAAVAVLGEFQQVLLGAEAQAGRTLADLADRLPAALDLVAHVADFRAPALLVKNLQSPATVEERSVLGTSSGAGLRAHPAAHLRRALFLAYADLPPAAATLFRRLWVFSGTFTAAACMEVAGLPDLATLRDALEPVFERGLVAEVHDSATERRRSQARSASVRPGAVAAAAAAASAGQPGAGKGPSPGAAALVSRAPLAVLGPDSRLRIHAVARALSAAAMQAVDSAGAFPNEQLLAAYCAHYRAALQAADDLVGSASVSRAAEGFRLFDADAHNFRAAAELARDGMAGNPAVATALLQPRLLYEVRLSAARRVQLYSSCVAALTPAQCKTAVQPRCFKYLADAYTELGLYEKAIPYYKQCQKRAEEQDNPSFVAAALYGLAKVSHLLREGEIALDYCKRCQPLLVQTSDDSGLAELLLFRARLQDELGTTGEAIAAAQESAAVAARGEDKVPLGRALQLQGEIRVRHQQFEEALEPLREASHVAHQAGDLRTLARALKGLDVACESLQRFYRAHIYRERLAQLMEHADIPLF